MSLWCFKCICYFITLSSVVYFLSLLSSMVLTLRNSPLWKITCSFRPAQRVLELKSVDEPDQFQTLAAEAWYHLYHLSFYKNSYLGVSVEALIIFQCLFSLSPLIGKSKTKICVVFHIFKPVSGRSLCFCVCLCVCLLAGC